MIRERGKFKVKKPTTAIFTGCSSLYLLLFLSLSNVLTCNCIDVRGRQEGAFLYLYYYYFYILTCVNICISIIMTTIKWPNRLSVKMRRQNRISKRISAGQNEPTFRYNRYVCTVHSLGQIHLYINLYI